MGAAPSIITVPSTSIAKDVECLKALCPSRFRLEQQPSSSDSVGQDTTNATAAVLKDKNGPLTLILAEIPVTAANRVVSNRITFVLQESELRSVINRCQHLRLVTKMHPSNSNSYSIMDNGDREQTAQIQMAELNLPGGAGFALVSPAMLATSAGRRELGQTLAGSMIQSLPKGLGINNVSTRANSSRSRSTNRASSTPRATPERRQSLGGGGGGSNGRGRSSTPTQRQSRVGPVVVSSRVSPRNSNTGGSKSNGTPNTQPYRSLSPSYLKTKLHNQKQQQLITNIAENKDLPSFPTLKFTSLHLNGKYKHDFVANSRVPIPIETELFVGHMLFLLRPTLEAEDSFWYEPVFANKNRRLVLQLQGKFKYEPKGPVYAGIEASNDLSLGRLSKGLAGLLLHWAEANNQHLYYSLGDDETEKHKKVVVPAQTFFDRIVVTPSGQTPPSMLDPLQERQESIDYRKQQSPDDINATKQAQWTWNSTDTYSMSFHTSNIDLPTWSLLNVPQLHDLGLSKLIGKSVLRFVMYENSSREKGVHHLQQHLRYGYAIQCKFLGSPASKESESGAQSENTTLLDWAKTPVTAAEEKNTSNSEDDSDALKLKQTESDKFPLEMRDVKEFDSGHFLEEESDDTGKLKKPTNLPDLRPSLSKEAFDGLANLDILCPAWIEMCAPQGKYTRAYAFNVNNRTVFRTPQSFRDLVSVKNYLPRLVTDAMIDKLCSPRIAKTERTRRRFGKMLEIALTGPNADMLKRMMEIYSSEFLRRRDVSWPDTEKPSGETGGLVARALSDRHWVEEWTEVTTSNITFAHPETKKVHFAIKMDCILCIRCVEKDEAPMFFNYFFMAVETLGSTTYIMFATEDDRRQCFTSISKFITSDSKLPLYLNVPRNEFLQTSSMWECDQRLIMNARRMSFRTLVPSEQLDPLEVVEDALARAFDQEIERDDDKLQLFLDSASKLKSVNTNGMKEERRVAFFLNLYHVMVTHATLIFGAIDSQSSRVKNLGCLSYQCSDDIFSIGELEHCIIRAQMTQLAPSVSITSPKSQLPINSRLFKATSPFQDSPSEMFNFPTPNSSFCFALQKADFRINFALNCGSRSNPAEIPIYTAHLLDDQLDDACKSYLNSKVAIKRRNKLHVCVLPRVCQWYAEDFGSTNYAILKTLEPYLSLQERKMLQTDEFANFPISIKYWPFSFECNHLSLKYEPPSLRPKPSEEEEEEMSTQSTHSSTSVSAPLSVVDAPSADSDMDNLLEFLMNDALEI